MFNSKLAVAFVLTITLASTLGAPQFAPITAQRPVYNEGGLLPGVGAFLGDLTTGLNGVLSGRPVYPAQAYVPVQQVQPLQPLRPVQQVQPMLPIQGIQQYQPMQPVQQYQPFQQFRKANKQ